MVRAVLMSAWASAQITQRSGQRWAWPLMIPIARLLTISSHCDTGEATWNCSAYHLSQFLVGQAHWARIHYQVVAEISFGDWSATQISKVFSGSPNWRFFLSSQLLYSSRIIFHSFSFLSLWEWSSDHSHGVDRHFQNEMHLFLEERWEGAFSEVDFKPRRQRLFYTISTYLRKYEWTHGTYAINTFIYQKKG